MGLTLTYKCNKCNYSAHVSGKPDSGMIVKTETKVCNGCKEVVDIIVEFISNVELDNNKSEIGKCPNCNSSDYLEQWSQRKCPKCNGKMTKRSDLMTTLWD